MNGLVNFISELRACRAHDLEQKRVNKELANIRAKFKDPHLNGYNRKKYVAKLLYMYILGFDIDFGHMEAVSLMQSSKYQEKQIAYIAVTMMISENNELAPLVVNSIRRDLNDINEQFNCLALHAISNICSREIAEMFTMDIYKLFISSNPTLVRKKAGLCLLRIYRKFPELVAGDDWANSILQTLNHDDLAICYASISLITALADKYEDDYSAGVSLSIKKLHSIVIMEEGARSDQYYNITSPWLQIKLLRFLQHYPTPIDPMILSQLNEIIDKILSGARNSYKKQQQINVHNAILFETINLAIAMKNSQEHLVKIGNILGTFLEEKETNLRYLALDAMSNIAKIGDPLGTLPRFQELVTASLQDKDVSVRRQALNLLYSMCNFDNVKAIVAELLGYIESTDHEIRPDIVLKVAIIAEKFVTEYTWYVDVMLKLITTAGDDASDALWHRVIYIITNNDELREYATYTIFKSLKQANCHEMAIKIAAYLLGEYGHIIVELPECSPYEQFMALHSKFALFSNETRCLLMNSYVKLVNLFPEIKQEIQKVFEAQQHSLHMELQQRACEYLALINQPTDDLLQVVCAEMPHFPEKESILLLQLKQKDEKKDAKVWNIGDTVQRSESKRKPSAIGTEQETDVVESSSRGVDIKQTPPSQSQLNEWQNNLELNPNGILYEDDIIQIGVKTEYQSHLGRIAIFYGNKLDFAFDNVKARLDCVPQLSISETLQLEISLEPLTQSQQMYNIECNEPFNGDLVLLLSFNVLGKSFSIERAIPVSICKFMTPVLLEADDFLARWRQIGGPPREASTVFSSKNGVNIEECKTLLVALNLQISQVDPNPLNTAAGGIFTCNNLGKIGCLVRVESNLERQAILISS